jgi:hypothetical protein
MCFSAGHSFQRLIYYRQSYSGRSIEVLGTLPTEVERSTSRLGYRLEIDQRYDGTLCLSAANAAAHECCELIPHQLSQSQVRHRWSPGSALIIDNWRSTHAREALEEGGDHDRRIIRYEVWQHARMDI